MGCESVKEKVEDEMVKMKLEREEIRTERYKILKILNEIDGGHRKAPIIHDKIDPEFNSKNSSKAINNQEMNKDNNIKIKRRSSRSKSTKAFIQNKNNIIYNNKIFNFEEDEDDKNDKENINIRKGKRRRTHKRKTIKY